MSRDRTPHLSRVRLTDGRVRETTSAPGGSRLTYLLGVAAAAALGLFGAACGDDEAESSTTDGSTSAVIDGELDCPADERLEPPAEVGGPGLPTPAEAIEALLGPTSERLGGRIERIDDTLGTLVVEGRELMRVRIRESDEGGWIGIPSYCAEVAGAYEGTGNSTPRTEPPVTATG